MAPPCRNGVGAALEPCLSRAGAIHALGRLGSYRRPMRPLSFLPRTTAQPIRQVLPNRETAAEAHHAVLDAREGAAPPGALLVGPEPEP